MATPRSEFDEFEDDTTPGCYAVAVLAPRQAAFRPSAWTPLTCSRLVYQVPCQPQACLSSTP
ncbi:MAG: hypothetical protein JRF07_08800 [Deltaproteobacteria bacterium]|nr:hypothetical protein [Deltaproteobacteria bacterium]